MAAKQKANEETHTQRFSSPTNNIRSDLNVQVTAIVEQKNQIKFQSATNTHAQWAKQTCFQADDVAAGARCIGKIISCNINVDQQLCGQASYIGRQGGGRGEG